MMKLVGPLAERDRWEATHCSIAKAVELVGTRSAILILREAFYGATRFDQFARRVGITDAVASARLKELTEAGVFTKVPYQDPGQRVRYEYLLTDMGRDLFPVVMSLMQWGNEHLQPDGAPLTVTDTTHNPVRVGVVTGEQKTLDPEDVEVRVNRSVR
ncbi:helix-turn-helix domain-containing protein [Gordonia rubripertincta]|uniref:Helix-turn-helix domain-containing protein n=2 Tax=Gordonia rubripertincta TaxID=36822 RepID=A0AAW4G7I3_GORRU|nr:helix-turn-helix domain-containing protein [Gordonia rubripertincta]MBM7279116.1 helix-turn-helix transcriptional regulator [Gordonia rubripertincta]MDG6782474.1 helix-turn-helix domain-containing protein [Gordonia rubripertincta]NKY64858.1 helix-turn-helix transcriptional regulator [Gordonia rubripertincta]QMU19912.1 helix-turn-helix transcriptional regulator [Gordonia rubripertincta]GAB84545.1 putative HxlR family transcriptional regulator [Gordonia rubripertincta NBRC 101908]